MSDDLPSGWTRARVAELASLFQYGSSAKTNDNASGGVPVLRMGNILNGRLRYGDLRYLPKDHTEFPTLYLEPGDILFNRTNSPELVGKTAVYDGNGPSPCSFASYLIRVRLRSYEPRLFAAFINSESGKAWIRSCVSQQVGQANVSGGKLKELEVPIPPLNEQRRIVAKLEDLLARSRRAKDALDAIPPLLEKLRQSILASAFRGDLTADWRAKHPDVEPAHELLKRIRVERRKKWEEAELGKMRTKGKVPGDDRWKAKYQEPEAVDVSGLPELPEGWCWASVDVVSWSHDSRRIPVKQGDRRERAGPFPYYGAFGIIDHIDEYIFDQPLVLIAEDGKNLLDRRRPISLVASGKYWVNNHAHVLEPIADLVPAAYLSEFFNATDLGERLTGIDQVKLTAGALANLPVPLGPPLEMREIAYRVSKALRALSILSKIAVSLDASDSQMRKALLAKAFRGELVEQDPNDEPASVMLDRLASERAASESAKPARAPAKREKRAR